MPALMPMVIFSPAFAGAIAAEIARAATAASANLLYFIVGFPLVMTNDSGRQV